VNLKEKLIKKMEICKLFKPLKNLSKSFSRNSRQIKNILEQKKNSLSTYIKQIFFPFVKISLIGFDCVHLKIILI